MPGQMPRQMPGQMPMGQMPGQMPMGQMGQMPVSQTNMLLQQIMGILRQRGYMGGRRKTKKRRSKK